MLFRSMFEGDDHALSRNVRKVESMVTEFVVGCAGDVMVSDSDERIVQADVVGGKEERVSAMEAGGDLRGRESLE